MSSPSVFVKSKSMSGTNLFPHLQPPHLQPPHPQQEPTSTTRKPSVLAISYLAKSRGQSLYKSALVQNRESLASDASQHQPLPNPRQKSRFSVGLDSSLDTAKVRIDSFDSESDRQSVQSDSRQSATAQKLQPSTLINPQRIRETKDAYASQDLACVEFQSPRESTTKRISVTFTTSDNDPAVQRRSSFKPLVRRRSTDSRRGSVDQSATRQSSLFTDRQDSILSSAPQSRQPSQTTSRQQSTTTPEVPKPNGGGGSIGAGSHRGSLMEAILAAHSKSVSRITADVGTSFADNSNDVSESTTTFAANEQFKQRARVLARQFHESKVQAKLAARKARIRKLWVTTIHRVIHMQQSTSAFGPSKHMATAAAELNLHDSSAIHEPSAIADLGFQIENFKVTNKPGGSNRIMLALMKEAKDRSREDVKALEILVATLPGLGRFSYLVKQAFARCVGYCRFGPGRTIIKQGHHAQNYYYVLSGTLEVHKTIENRTTYVGRMTPGQTFGDLALLSTAQRRLATVTTSTSTELLYLTKDDFEQVVKKETMKEIEERVGFLKAHEVFGRLGDEAVWNLAMTGQTFDVAPDTLIVGEGEVPNSVFLVCDGECKLLKCIEFAKVYTNPPPPRPHPRNYTANHYSTAKYNLYPYPLPPGTETPFGFTVHPRLIRIAVASEGYHTGTLQAFQTAGSPNQLALLSPYINISNLAPPSTCSLMSLTRCKYLTLNRHAFTKELVHYPDLAREIAGFVISEEKGLDVGVAQRLYLERFRWGRFKENVMGGILEGLKKARSSGGGCGGRDEDKYRPLRSIDLLQ